MKVKKYVASSMPEAMKLIRAELGNDAVILNSKMIQTGGFLGFFKKKNIEVIAAVDPKPIQHTQVNGNSKKNTKEITPQIEKRVIESKTQLPSQLKGSDELITELTELKALMKTISIQDVGTSSFLPEPVKNVDQILRNQEVSSGMIEKTIGKLLEKWFITGANASKKDVLGWASEVIIDENSQLSFGGITFNKKFVNVVGPTGVGKTTTLAKIAADCVLKHKKKVAFITTDTYRIAAIDQLKTYAKILNIPIEVCYNINDFEEATKKFDEFDVVLIDTAGRNFRNHQYVEDLKKVIDFNNDMETFLVLALTSKQKDMEDIFLQFSTIHIDRLIFTKIDETSQYGSMLNIIEKYQTGVAYLTNGQDVPDDMITATSEIIANTVLGVDLK
ncbi:flagellar biosynthesis protein FlhF [Bacillus sp. CGMCC 1.16607]|uniref:flagellar biosynthesis protein FlhF n=1 Tax=Bacillus sp. CGMCC 1.16607 TaxID=3351842 RepID=UPI00363C4818